MSAKLRLNQGNGLSRSHKGSTTHDHATLIQEDGHIKFEYALINPQNEAAHPRLNTHGSVYNKRPRAYSAARFQHPGIKFRLLQLGFVLGDALVQVAPRVHEISYGRMI
jgi:hypothetical protein